MGMEMTAVPDCSRIFTCNPVRCVWGHLVSGDSGSSPFDGLYGIHLSWNKKVVICSGGFSGNHSGNFLWKSAVSCRRDISADVFAGNTGWSTGECAGKTGFKGI